LFDEKSILLKSCRNCFIKLIFGISTEMKLFKFYPQMFELTPGPVEELEVFVRVLRREDSVEVGRLRHLVLQPHEEPGGEERKL
jgi:hypothetical protein